MYELCLSALDEHSYSTDGIPPMFPMNLKPVRDTPDDDNTNIHRGRLIVHKIDNQSIEADRLPVIGLNTTELRTCHASSLYTYFDKQLQEKGYKFEKLVNLPKSFVGCRLWTRFDSWVTEPPLCARVFLLRLRSLIREIIKKKIFGEVVALQYSIEYQ
ncbi:hypothetical protein ANCCEY_06110 [Ancylostoma ceylanicum]|uniref:Helitron helicase-like domain-containing protein n=1 Tax=Ancylostoma ceylanicum TaxID=53326 RepID=A0A0D6LUF9_9BILA|nr:hypothetical protein ANCCEY_06110 [Ancylostoma ceylanicum]